MKKLLLGILIGIVLFIPATVLAKEIYETNAKPLIHVGTNESKHGVWVHVFDDGDNKCYVAVDGNEINPAISCVKRD